MATCELHLPILIEQGKQGYTIQPLLFSGPKIFAARYGNAVNLLQKSIRKQFKHIKITRENIDALLWYRFSPEFHFEVERFQFPAGMQYVDGHFVMVTYTVAQHKYVCFPGLNHHTFRVELQERGRTAFVNFLCEKLIQYFQRERKDQGDDFKYEPYYSSPNASNSSISVQIETAKPIFHFEEEDNSIYALFGHQNQFDGAEELEKVADDLLNESDNLENTFFRKNEKEWLERTLFGSRPQAAVIVGPEGIGKSNLISHTYQQYLFNNPQKSSSLLQRIWRLDPLRVISGMSVVGQWERRFESILCRIRDRIRSNTNGKHKQTDILLIQNPVALLRIGKTSQTDLTLAHLLIPYIERREFPVILEATPEEWQKVQDINRRFADLFQVQRLAPLKEDENNYVVTQRRAQIERQFECEFDVSALIAIMKSEQKLRGTKEQPGSLVDMIRDVAITSQNMRINEAMIFSTLQESYNVNKKIIDHNETLTHGNIESYFKNNLIGQDTVISTLVDTVLAIKSQLTPEGKPLNTLLFIGPTGVGKTEAAKLLANYLFSKEDCLVRIDMNEFVDEFAVNRLIGSEHNPYGILTERVRYQKSCVLLLDEIEKAHPRVHDILLQVLDDGRLTDASGNTTDFSQAVIIMTSNIGAQEASMQMGFVENAQDTKATYLKSLEKVFRPEMINRINQIEVFNALKRKDMAFLAKLHLSKLLKRDGFTRRSTILNVSQDCLDHLADQGYDPSLGARALKRNLERIITHSTAKRMAESDSDAPIILNMWLDGKTVRSETTHLVFASQNNKSIPNNIKLDIKQYRTLNDTLSELENRITGEENDTSLDQQYTYLKWSLLDTIRSTQEPLQRFVYDYEDRAAATLSTINFSFRNAPPRYFDSVKQPRIDFSSLHAHDDILTFLNNTYTQAESYFELDKNNDFALWNSINQLSHASHCMVNRGIDEGYLYIQTLVTNKGERGINKLAQTYKKTLDKIGHIDEISRTPETCLLNVHGLGIHEIFEAESGVHLFCEQGNLQVPILVRYFKDDLKSVQEKTTNPKALLTGNMEIIRLYSDDKNPQQRNTITDIRSGLMIEDMEPEQWSVIFLSSLPNIIGIQPGVNTKANAGEQHGN